MDANDDAYITASQRLARIRELLEEAGHTLTVINADTTDEQKPGEEQQWNTQA